MKTIDLTVDQRMELRALTAAANDYAYEGGVLPDDASEVSEGAPFTIAVVIPTGMESGDGRSLLPNSLSVRDLPIPLLWQPKTGTGHDGSYVVGRIDTVEVTPEGAKNAKGVFDTGPYGREAERLVRHGFLRGISADLDKFEPLEGPELEEYAATGGEDGAPIDVTNKLLIKTARVMAATLLPKPAFQECTISIDDEAPATSQEIPVVDGTHESENALAESADYAAAAMTASAIPVNPPDEWFEDPRLTTETALRVDEDGRVFGHIATWVQDHVGYNYSVRPPRSRSGYAYFHTGLVRTETGTEVPVGQLTLAGGHAPLDASAAKAVEHYDSTQSAIADVHAGEDRFGIWVAGALRPGVTPEQVRTMRASAPSGDWRPINGVLELVAICQVNVPGFPIARARVASGACIAVVAAGSSTLYGNRATQAPATELTELEQRVALLESAKLREASMSAISRIQNAQELALKRTADKALSRLAPALQARADRQAELQAQAEALRARIEEFEFKVRPKYVEAEHPRNEHGQWREVLGRLSELFKGDEDDRGAIAAVEEAAKAEDDGDAAGAEAKGREALSKLAEVDDDANVSDEFKDEVAKVADDVVAKLPDSETVTGDPESGIDGEETGKPKDGISDEIVSAISDIVDQLIDELGESADPQTLADRAFNQLKHYVDDSGVKPEELLDLINKKIEKQLQPDVVQ